MAAQAIHINTLALELLTNICSHLSVRNLKSFRLVSTQFECAAQIELFKNVFLYPTRSSFERLLKLANHTTISKHVRVIHYDCRVFDDPNGHVLEYPEWLAYNAGRGLGLGSKAIRNLLNQIPQDQLEKCYQNYCLWLIGEEELRNGNAMGMLEDALKKFEGLSGIRISQAFPACQRSPRAPSLSSLGPMARKILAEPRGLANEQIFIFLQSAFLAGRSGYLKDIEITRFNLDYWKGVPELLNSCFGSMSGLQHLALDFRRSTHEFYLPPFTRLRRLIAQAPLLQSLRLSFHDATVSLSTVISDATELKYLKNLSLGTMTATESCLRNFLSKHTTTLRTLELTDIYLEKETEDENCPTPSWNQLIQSMRYSLSLTHIKFCGVMRAWPYGFWIVHQGPQCGRHCLACQVERFITHGGSCPITPTTGRSAGWVFDVKDLEDEVLVPHLWESEEFTRESDSDGSNGTGSDNQPDPRFE